MTDVLIARPLSDVRSNNHNNITSNNLTSEDKYKLHKAPNFIIWKDTESTSYNLNNNTDVL